MKCLFRVASTSIALWLGLGVCLPGSFAAPENIAAGVSYECAVPPNYWGWKNPNHSDVGQLTDGAVVETWSTDEGPIYTLRSSLGWMSTPPVIIFDLGETRTIGGVGLHTVLSFWGPWWPAKLSVLVSDDAQNFRLAGTTFAPTPDQLDPPLAPETVQAAIDRVLPEKNLAPTTHWLRTSNLNARGRYVALLMAFPQDTGAVVFDEVEIYAGEVKEPFTPYPSPVFSEGEGGWKSHRLFVALEKRLTRDVATVRKKIETSSVADAVRKSLLGELNEVEEKISSQPIPPTDAFRAVYPVTALQSELFFIQAALWRGQGAPALRAWKTHRWDPLDPFAAPDGGAPSLQITAAQRSVRSDVLNLSNAGDRTVVVNIGLDDLPKKTLDVFEVPFVDTHDLEPVAAALVPAKQTDAGLVVSIPPGMTRQLWIRCRTRGLSPGQTDGTIRLSSDDPDVEDLEVPISISIADVRLPKRLSLQLGGWDYPAAGTYQVTAENLKAYVRMLKEYGVNVTWKAGMPTGTYDDEDNLVTPPPRGEIDEWLSFFPDAGHYCIVSAFGKDRSEKFVTEWARDWSAYFEEKGIDPEKIAYLIRDEPNSADELEIIHRFGKAIKAGEPRFKIFNDIHFADPLKAPPILESVMRDACDIQCFNVGHYLSAPAGNEAFREQHGREGLQWWCYTGGQGHRLTDPYIAWHLRPWFAFKRGLTGTSWWAFGDGNGGFSWREYFNSGATRSPLYLDRDAVHAGKSMEAMREGAQDYELLQMLSAASDKDRARIGIEVDRVLEAHTQDLWLWNTPKDRSVTDKVRHEILRLLEAL
jgi:hypothetical protein